MRVRRWRAATWRWGGGSESAPRARLKAIITAYGPFAARDGAALEQAVRDELQQPPHSPHLLRYYSHFNGIVEGGRGAGVVARCPDHARRLAQEVLADAAVPDGNLWAGWW